MRPVLFFVCFALLSGCVLLFWIRNYPNPDDPKNIEYVLWKCGLNPKMNLDTALMAMTHDGWPVRRVAGLTKKQLQTRFGYIHTGAEATPCGEANRLWTIWGIHPPAAEVVTLRNGNWMVLLKNGIAVDLRICKG